jgi:hypothetical protein
MTSASGPHPFEHRRPQEQSPHLLRLAVQHLRDQLLGNRELAAGELGEPLRVRICDSPPAIDTGACAGHVVLDEGHRLRVRELRDDDACGRWVASQVPGKLRGRSSAGV